MEHKENSFERQVNEVINKGEFPYDSASWQKLENGLRKYNRKQIWLKKALWIFSGAILIGFLVGFGVSNWNSKLAINSFEISKLKASDSLYNSNISAKSNLVKEELQTKVHESIANDVNINETKVVINKNDANNKNHANKQKHKYDEIIIKNIETTNNKKTERAEKGIKNNRPRGPNPKLTELAKRQTQKKKELLAKENIAPTLLIETAEKEKQTDSLLAQFNNRILKDTGDLSLEVKNALNKGLEKEEQQDSNIDKFEPLLNKNEMQTNIDTMSYRYGPLLGFNFASRWMNSVTKPGISAGLFAEKMIKKKSVLGVSVSYKKMNFAIRGIDINLLTIRNQFWQTGNLPSTGTGVVSMIAIPIVYQHYFKGSKNTSFFVTASIDNNLILSEKHSFTYPSTQTGISDWNNNQAFYQPLNGLSFGVGKQYILDNDRRASFELNFSIPTGEFIGRSRTPVNILSFKTKYLFFQ